MINWAYIAGFFDGEGHIRQDQLQISQSRDRGLLMLSRVKDWLANEGIHSGVQSNPYIRKGQTDLSHYLYITNRDNIEKFLNGVLPYLEIKRTEAQDTLRYFRLFPRRNKGGFVVPGNAEWGC
jgi:LAGLIDADG-like domain